VHTSAECKTDISVVLTVTSSSDSHMMSKLESLDTRRWNSFEVATSCFGAILCWQDCYPAFLIGVDPRIIITARIVSLKYINNYLH